MPITHYGLSRGLSAARVTGDSGQTSPVYIRALTSADVVLGTSAQAGWGDTEDKSDGSSFKARDFLYADTVINITTTGVVAKLQFIFIGNMPAGVVTGGQGTAAGNRFNITLDSTLSVVSGGYLTVKGGSSTNTYIEIQSSKSS